MRAAALCALLLLPGAAQAITGNDLQRVCTETEANFSSGQCLGYLDGYLDGVSMATSAAPLFCLPPKTTLNQVKNVVMKWMQDNPHRTHLDASFIVVLSVGVAFPCRTKP